jgi:UDP-N-acetylglucosamine 2-epimerase (non-hydrolysing)
MKRIVSFIGTRPEAIKMAPVVHALRQSRELEAVVVTTGQHREMLQQVINLFAIPVHHDLAVMQPNQTLASLTARLAAGMGNLLAEIRPAMVLAQGDTTTTFMASLSAFYQQIPFGHVEAGLRTGDLFAPFPEEANRRLTTSLTALHFPPTEESRQNLLREGVSDDCITVTGNTVIDALQMEVRQQELPDIRQRIDQAMAHTLGPGWSDRPFVLITGHRRENFGSGFDEICKAIGELAARFPGHQFIYPVHLNPNVQRPVHGFLGGRSNIRLIVPQDYRCFIALLRHCKIVLTDSGGVQEEGPSLGKPVLVMRDKTERPEGVAAGTVRLVGADAARIVASVTELLTDADSFRRMAEATNPYGDGHAAPRIVNRILDYFSLRS